MIEWIKKKFTIKRIIFHALHFSIYVFIGVLFYKLPEKTLNIIMLYYFFWRLYVLAEYISKDILEKKEQK